MRRTPSLLALWIAGIVSAATPSNPEPKAPGNLALVFPRSPQAREAVSSRLHVERVVGDALLARADASTLSALEAEGHRVERLPDPLRLELRHGAVDLRRFPLESLPSDGRIVPVVVAFDGPPPARIWERMRALGMQPVGAIPPSSYLVRGDRRALKALRAEPPVAAVAPYRPEWKIGPRVPAGPSSVQVEIVGFPDASLDAVARFVGGKGGFLRRGSLLERQVIRAELPSEALAGASGFPEVEWIDAVPLGGFFNNEIRVVMQTERKFPGANIAFYNPVYGIGVHGTGEKIAVADTGILATHEVFGAPQKFVQYVPANSCGVLGDPPFGGQGHGTGVACTAAGDSPGNVSMGFHTPDGYDGLAFDASLIIQDIEDLQGNFCPPPNPVQDLFIRANQEGARIHNNSWGHGIVYPPQDPYGPDTGTYTATTWAIDQYLNRPLYRDDVVVFSAGNTGGFWQWSGSYWYVAYVPRSLSDESHAKNVITVGGSRNGDARHVMYLFSSHGPTNDCGSPPCTQPGRIKPDVVAPAIPVTSANSQHDADYYNPFSGTSFSAPAVSAAAALVRDYFRQGIYPNDASDPPVTLPPSSALVKAALVNSTVFLWDSSAYAGNAGAGLPPNAYPNYTQGFGRPALDTVLEPAGYRTLKAFDDATTKLRTGEVWSRTVTFPDIWHAGCNQLRFTLAWTDPPMTLGSSVALVDDLDLEVTFGGAIHRRNEGLTGGAFDHLNNVEDVVIALGNQNGAAVTADVRVYGFSVPGPNPRPFALCRDVGTLLRQHALPARRRMLCRAGRRRAGDPAAPRVPGPGLLDRRVPVLRRRTRGRRATRRAADRSARSRARRSGCSSRSPWVCDPRCSRPGTRTRMRREGEG